MFGMLTFKQAVKSLTNWAAFGMIAAPEIWNTIITDPSIHVPDKIQHKVALAGAICVILARTWNRQGGNLPIPKANILNPPSKPLP